MQGFLNIGKKEPKDQYNDVAPDFIETPDFGALYTALPFDSQPADIMNTDISEVTPLAGIVQVGSPVQPTQDIWNDLIAIRAKMPWLPIIQFPQAIRTVFMPVANVAVDIDIPTSAAFMRFAGPQDFYASLGNRAVVPNATGDREASSLYKPDGYIFIGGVKQVSVVSPAANAIVQIAFWQH